MNESISCGTSRQWRIIQCTDGDERFGQISIIGLMGAKFLTVGEEVIITEMEKT